MFNWLIKLLGGYTEREYIETYDKTLAQVRSGYERVIGELKKELKQAHKNDMPRDPKTGRFVSRK